MGEVTAMVVIWGSEPVEENSQISIRLCLCLSEQADTQYFHLQRRAIRTAKNDKTLEGN